MDRDVKEQIKNFNRIFALVKTWSRITDPAVLKATVQEDSALNQMALLSMTISGMSLLYPRHSALWNHLIARGITEAKIRTGWDMAEEVRIIAGQAERTDFHDDFAKILLEAMEALIAETQKLLREIDPGPTNFSYAGFSIVNVGDVPGTVVAQYLNGLDEAVALFKRRGVEDVIRSSLTRIEFHNPEVGDQMEGFYSYDSKVMTIHAHYDLTPRFLARWLPEVIVHELGHHVHMNYISAEAKAFWDAGWVEVNKASENLLESLKITGADRKKFFKLIEANGWDPKKAGAKLKGLARLKFMQWLGQPKVDSEILSSPTQIRLTKYGQDMFSFYANPEGFVKRDNPHLTDPADIQKSIDRRFRIYNWALGLQDNQGGESYALNEEATAEITAKDSTVKEAIEALGIPSDYGKTNYQEDFAETFVLFLSDPAKLSETARYRMQRALWLSGASGKPVMRLAKRVAQIWLASLGK